MGENIGNTKDKFDCVQCGKTYGTKGSLRTHKYIHIKKELKLEDVQDNTNQSEDPQEERNYVKVKEDDKDENKRQTFEEKYKASLHPADEVEILNEILNDESPHDDQSKEGPIMGLDNSEL